MTVKRTTCEKYIIYIEKGPSLATVFLDDQVGEISIQSNYGDYAYWWSKPGRGTETLKEFLSRTDSDYVMKKFGYGGKNDHFFPDETTNRIKEEILKNRKDRRIDKEQARECFDEIEDMDDTCDTSSEYYGQLDRWAPTVMELIYDNSSYDIPWVNGTHPQLQAFMKEVWPLFIGQIKMELKEKL
jgi:hypothetical protein